MRRWVGRLTLVLVCAVLASAVVRAPAPHEAHVSLYLDGVHLMADGTVAPVPAGSGATYLPGSRVLAGDPAARDRAAAQRAWLATGTVPGAGTAYEELVAGALLDLHTLTGARLRGAGGAVTPASPGAAVAGWTDRWRYVWPRDAAFVAVALARTGHPEDAREVLAFLAGVQAGDGLLEARYLPDGSGPPDGRGIQLDGLGWVLWAAGEVLAELDAATAQEAFAELRPLVDRASEQVLALTAGASHLPPPSPDYWEVPERELTLGTVAPMLAGLESAAGVYARAGHAGRAETIRTRAVEVRGAVEDAFGPGYHRYARTGPLALLRGSGHRDAATAVLLPPFVPVPLAGAEAAWLASAEEMARPAGGLAPGAGWKQDGISWTPQTSLYALAAASNGHPGLAREWLDWLAAHRTASGAIPEKVLADGAPAAVAPLTWSSANVVLAVLALEEAGALERAPGAR
ncbi:glycoside hydrolase family 15 [Georgenia wangjunii]|uniref:glycoside hydrolase family 15 n=1 Tax=Georgenia wangjunii TaxID=3117730 RepID=UPI002F260DC0